jgi:hypothetical protein
MADVEPEFPELAKRIRNGTFIVVWQAKIFPKAEDNTPFYLGYELGIEEKGGWVLMADCERKKVTAEEFAKIRPIPSE